MTKEFIEELIGNARFKSAQCKFNAIGEKREGNMKEYSELLDRSNYFALLADYLSQHPLMQEGEKETMKDNGSFFEPIEFQDMVGSNISVDNEPPIYNKCTFGTPRTSQDDDFGAHKTNVL